MRWGVCVGVDAGAGDDYGGDGEGEDGEGEKDEDDRDVEEEEEDRSQVEARPWVGERGVGRWMFYSSIPTPIRV